MADEIMKFIKEERELNKKTWQEIADALSSAGHKSRRTGNKITSATVRFKYYESLRATKNDSTAKAILKILNQDKTAKAKLAMIEEFLELGF